MRSSKIKNFLGLICLITCSFANGKTNINIGVLLRLEDAYNTFPRKILTGIEHHSRESKIRAKIIKVSHDGTTKSIANGVQKLVDRNVSVIIGGETSSDAIQISRFTQNKNIVFVSPSASSNKIHQYNSYAFRMMLDGSKMVPMVESVVKTKGCKRTGVFHNLTKPNWNRISKMVIEKIEDPVVVKALSDITDLEKTLKPFVQNKVDCIALFSFESDFRTIYSHMLKNNLHPIYIGSDGWGTNKNLLEKYVQPAKDTSFEAYRALYWNNSRQDSYFKTTSKKFEKENGIQLGPFSAIGFDTMKIVLDTLSSMDKSRFSAKLFTEKAKNLTFVKTLTANTIRFGEDNSPLKDINVYRIRGDEEISFWKRITL